MSGDGIRGTFAVKCPREGLNNINSLCRLDWERSAIKSLKSSPVFFAPVPTCELSPESFKWTMFVTVASVLLIRRLIVVIFTVISLQLQCEDKLKRERVESRAGWEACAWPSQQPSTFIGIFAAMSL